MAAARVLSTRAGRSTFATESFAGDSFSTRSTTRESKASKAFANYRSEKREELLLPAVEALLRRKEQVLAFDGPVRACLSSTAFGRSILVTYSPLDAEV